MRGGWLGDGEMRGAVRVGGVRLGGVVVGEGGRQGGEGERGEWRLGVGGCCLGEGEDGMGLVYSKGWGSMGDCVCIGALREGEGRGIGD